MHSSLIPPAVIADDRRRVGPRLGQVIWVDGRPEQERPFGLRMGTEDVSRRRLSEAEVVGTVEPEVAERRRPIDECRGPGADTGSLEIELATLQRSGRQP